MAGKNYRQLGDKPKKAAGRRNIPPHARPDPAQDEGSPRHDATRHDTTPGHGASMHLTVSKTTCRGPSYRRDGGHDEASVCLFGEKAETVAPVVSRCRAALCQDSELRPATPLAAGPELAWYSNVMYLLI